MRIYRYIIIHLYNPYISSKFLVFPCFFGAHLACAELERSRARCRRSSMAFSKGSDWSKHLSRCYWTLLGSMTIDTNQNCVVWNHPLPIILPRQKMMRLHIFRVVCQVSESHVVRWLFYVCSTVCPLSEILESFTAKPKDPQPMPFIIYIH